MSGAIHPHRIDQTLRRTSMIRTRAPNPAVHAAESTPARRHAVIAVLTGSSRDVTVARLADERAAAESVQLVLAVPVPAKPFGPSRADLSGRRHTPQATTVAARVLARLAH